MPRKKKRSWSYQRKAKFAAKKLLDLSTKVKDKPKEQPIETDELGNLKILKGLSSLNKVKIRLASVTEELRLMREERDYLLNQVEGLAVKHKQEMERFRNDADNRRLNLAGQFMQQWSNIVIAAERVITGVQPSRYDNSVGQVTERFDWKNREETPSGNRTKI